MLRFVGLDHLISNRSTEDKTLDLLSLSEKRRLIKEAKTRAKLTKSKEKEANIPPAIVPVAASEISKEIMHDELVYDWWDYTFEEKLLQVNFLDPARYIVLHDYEGLAGSADDLKVKRGDEFVLIEKGWLGDKYYGYIERNPDVKGNLPERLLVRPHGLGIYSWYHGAMTRDVAVKRLAAGINGSFLVYMAYDENAVDSMGNPTIKNSSLTSLHLQTINNTTMFSSTSTISASPTPSTDPKFNPISPINTNSISSSTGYFLSVKHDGRTTDFDIKYNGSINQYYISRRKFFLTVPNLIEFYLKATASVSRSTGLRTKLEFICPKLYIHPKDKKNNAMTSTDTTTSPSSIASITSTLATTANSVLQTSINTNTYEVSRPYLLLGKRLGTGQFGDVYRGVWMNSIPCAVKTMKDVNNEEDLKEFLYEANVMKLLNNNFCVKLLGVCTLEKPYLILIEYMSRGSLKSFVSNELFMQSTNSEMIAALFQDVAAGMAYLEQMHICHRDLAARNILVSINLRLKIADFGMSKKFVSNEETSINGSYIAPKGSKFPIRWTSPESLLENKFNSKTDVWSFGVTLWEALTYGQQPYKEWSVKKVIHEVTQSHNKLQRPPDCAQWIYNILSDTWKKDPLFRPTFEGIFLELQTRETDETKENVHCLRYIFLSKDDDKDDSRSSNQTGRYYKSMKGGYGKYYKSVSTGGYATSTVTLGKKSNYKTIEEEEV